MRKWLAELAAAASGTACCNINGCCFQTSSFTSFSSQLFAEASHSKLAIAALFQSFLLLKLICSAISERQAAFATMLRHCVFGVLLDALEVN
jgi:hypothetical protein